MSFFGQLGAMTGASTLEALEAMIVYDVRMIQQLCYVGIGTVAVIVWDWMICFEAERRLIWCRKKNTASWYYIFFRLYAFTFSCWNVVVQNARMKNIKFCRATLTMNSIVELILVFVMSSMMQGRVYAMYGRSKRILYFNAVCFAITAAIVIVVFILELPNIVIVPLPKPILGCGATVPPNLWAPWVPTIFMEAIICVEVIAKALPSIRQGTWKTQGTLFSLMVWDYATWFTVSALITFTNLFVYIYAPSGYKDFGLPFFHCISCTSGCHLVLNLRGAYYHDATISKTRTVVTGVSIDFRAPTMATASDDPEMEMDLI